MTRKTTTITLSDVPESDRDRGKVFQLTEHDALTAWKWGSKAITAMIRNGAAIPEEIKNGGIIQVLAVGVFQLGYLPWADLEPLLDELMACVRYVPTPERPDVVRKLFLTDVEEPTTYSRLAKEVFHLHTGFFPTDSPSTSPAGGAGGAPS